MTDHGPGGDANERTTVDVVCTGMVFLDLIFEGLDELWDAAKAEERMTT